MIPILVKNDDYYLLNWMELLIIRIALLPSSFNFLTTFPVHDLQNLIGVNWHAITIPIAMNWGFNFDVDFT